MADTKITSLLTPQVTTNPATDVLPIVNIADTSMASSGSTRKITVNTLLGAGGTATLASATITGDLTVRTNKLAVNATGVAIGAASASYPLDVTGTSRFVGDAYLYSTTGGAAFSKSLIFGSAANISAASIYGQTATANSGILYLATQTGGVMTDRLSIDSSGVFTFQNVGGAGTAMTLDATGLGVGVVPSAGKGALQLSSGINFPATQVASSDANTLDDYEEGTFTPTIEGQTTAGVGTYVNQVGRYTKIGNLVTVQIHLNWTAHTGTGNILIAGLPFTSSGVGNLIGSASIGYIDNLTLTAGNIPLAYVLNANTRIQLVQTPTGGGAIALVPMDTSATIVLTSTYMV